MSRHSRETSFSKDIESGCCAYARDNKPFQIVCGILLGIGVLLTVILVPLSFRYVRYDEQCFVRDKFGVVDTNSIVTQGRHFFTLNYDLVCFPSTLTKIQYLQKDNTNLNVFTSDGFQIGLDIVFFYRISSENLAKIYNKYGTNYEVTVINEAKQIIKNFAGTSSTGFNIPIKDYITKRRDISSQMAKSVFDGLFSVIGVDAPKQYFKIMNINIPQSMIDQYLKTVLQFQDNLIQQNKQSIVQVVAETETLVEAINVQSNFTIANAQIQSNEIISNAQSLASNIVSTARSKGIQYIFNTLNFTNSEDKSKLNRLMSIGDNPDKRIMFGVTNQVIVS